MEKPASPLFNTLDWISGAVESLRRCHIRSFYSRNAKKLRILLLVLVVFVVSLFTIKKFSKMREERALMNKIIDYINREMDRILSLDTRDEQNEEFRRLETKLPLVPVRMTLTTAVFKYTNTNPIVILKRIIHNPLNQLNEDYMSLNLRGPNIVKTLKTFRTKRMLPEGKEQTLLWIFSEFLDVKLSQKSVHGDENKIREILRGALQGLLHLHTLSIAHLDLKIGNVMGKSTPKGIVYKLIDFGYAQVMPSSGSVVIPSKNYGTYPYKPPEIVFNNTHGLSSDVWSLGAIAWFLSLHYTPFYADNFKKDLSAYKRFLGSRKSDPSNHKFVFNPKTSPSLKRFIKTCMQVDAKQRPSVRELLNHPFITNQPVRDYDNSMDEVDVDSSSNLSASSSVV